MNKIDKARIYINSYKKEKVTNSDIEIKGSCLANSKWYDIVSSPTNKFISFAYTEKVEYYYMSKFIRKEKLLKIFNIT